jgi:hypothetical protein
VKGKPCKPYNSTLGEFFRVCIRLAYYDSIAYAHSVHGTSKIHSRN